MARLESAHLHQVGLGETEGKQSLLPRRRHAKALSGLFLLENKRGGEAGSDYGAHRSHRVPSAPKTYRLDQTRISDATESYRELEGSAVS